MDQGHCPGTAAPQPARKAAAQSLPQSRAKGCADDRLLLCRDALQAALCVKQGSVLPAASSGAEALGTMLVNAGSVESASASISPGSLAQLGLVTHSGSPVLLSKRVPHLHSHFPDAVLQKWLSCETAVTASLSVLVSGSPALVWIEMYHADLAHLSTEQSTAWRHFLTSALSGMSRGTAWRRFPGLQSHRQQRLADACTWGPSGTRGWRNRAHRALRQHLCQLVLCPFW